MAIDPNIKQKAADIRTKVFGSEVRESLASGLEGMSEDVESIKGRQGNVESQFQNVIDETTGKDVISAPELIAARNGKSNLKTRLDEEHAQVTAQLQQTEQNLTAQLAQIETKEELNSMNFTALKYGKIELPTDFNKLLDFEFFRKSSGVIESNFKLSNIIRPEVTVYVGEQGNDNNNGLTKETAVRTLVKAFEIANGRSEAGVAINILTKYFSRGGAGSNITFSLSKNILVQADESIGQAFVGSFARMDTAVWTKEGNEYWTPTNDRPHHILDGAILDFRGIPYEYEKRPTDLQTTLSPGQWTYDTANNRIYVRPLNQNFDTKKIMRVETHFKNIFEIGNKTLAFKNIDFVYNSNVVDELNQGMGGVDVRSNVNGSKVIFENCSSSYAFKNGYYIRGVEKTYMINSTASNNGFDGFNYNGRKSGTPQELIVEFNCHSYDNGRINTNPTNNATTAHGGVHILRIGSIGSKSNGPTCADVQGCYSILYDCHMRDNYTPYEGAATDASFYFDNQDQTTGKGKAILVNCSSPKNDSGYGLSTDGTMDLKINNFNGKIKKDIPYSFI